MRPYAIIDLHCDTLTDCMYAASEIPDTLDAPARSLSLSNIPGDVHWAQFFAVFLPDRLRGEEAVRFFDASHENFERQMQKFSSRVSPCRNVADMERAWAAGKTAAFLSVENGSAFAGDLSRIEKLKRQGVCAVTLTWNGENELGSGNVTDRGLTDFGRAAVREMERCGILVDVSHLNDAGLEDVFETAEKPFVATHSGMYAALMTSTGTSRTFSTSARRRTSPLARISTARTCRSAFPRQKRSWRLTAICSHAV